VHAIPISEHILALLLAFARGVHRAVRDQGRGEWVPYEQQQVFELYGKTMLLIGVGAIGERTAQAANTLGMRVWGVRRNPDDGAPGVERMFGPGQLHDALPEADFVVLTTPLTHETQGMIGEPELRAMKPTAILVNIGRGGTIQEGALVQALQEGWIAGAGLDVFETEPLPEDSPLWAMDNVIITAHYAGSTPQYMERALEIFLDNLRRYRAGERLRNVVDKRLGY
jgi:phosphoglycerate dehydrogenase-like enzyme